MVWCATRVDPWPNVIYNLYVSDLLPQLVHFNMLTTLQYTPAVQLLSYKDVRKN